MGAIFAIERDGVVYLGADAVKQCCDVNYYVESAENLKLHIMPNGIIVAAMGLMYLTQQLWLHDEWFTLEEGEVFDKKFIVTKIIPRYYEAVCDMDGWEEKERGFHKVIEVGFIIAKGSDFYMVFNDLSVIKCDGIAAMSDEDADMIMLSYATASREENPEKLIRDTYAFVSRCNQLISTHGFITNTRDFTLKRMEDVQ